MAIAGRGDSPFKTSWASSLGKGGRGDIKRLYKSTGQPNNGGNLLYVSFVNFFLGNLPVKIWSGSAWMAKPIKVWDGSSWNIKTLKRWNGSLWVIVNY
jgi:hypothetical protein